MPHTLKFTENHVAIRALHGHLKFTVGMPPDKSISHRALFLNALAEGEARITNLLEGVDIWNSITCLRKLGVEIDHQGNGAATVRGIGRGKIKEPGSVLFVGTSACTIRFLLGFVAPFEIFAVIEGGGRTNQRPMARVTRPLREMGVWITGRDDGNHAPIAIRGGGLKGIDYLNEHSSGEVKTALMTAALRASETSLIRNPFRSRDHTERMLARMGADFHEETDGSIVVRPGTEPLKPLNYRIPGEISAAVYWIVFGLLHPHCEIVIEDVCLNPMRTGLLQVLREMGGDIQTEETPGDGVEPVGRIIVRTSKLKGIVVGPEYYTRMQDEFPGFALAAALAEGKTIIRGVGDLRNKKTNRIENTASQYLRLGAKVECTSDGMIFEGVKSLKGASVSGCGDHRLTQSLVFAGFLADGTTIVENFDLIESTSYPGFWNQVEGILGGSEKSGGGVLLPQVRHQRLSLFADAGK